MNLFSKIPLFLIFFFIFFIKKEGFSQNNYSLKFFGLGLHPFSDENSALAKSKLDKNGVFTFEPGIIFSSEFFINTNMVSLKPMQSIYLDKMGKIAGFTHFGIRAYVLNHKRHTLALGLGATLFYHKDWSNLPNYIENDKYNLITPYQYKLFLLSGEIEYNYYYSKMNYLTFSLNHIDLEGFTFAFGVKHLFKYKKKKPNRKHKACDCPSYR